MISGAYEFSFTRGSGIQILEAPVLYRFGLWGKGLCRVSAQKGSGSFSLNLHTHPIIRA